MTGRNWAVGLALLGLAACGESGSDRGPEFGFDRASAVATPDINMLRLDRETAPSGIARLDGDVLLPIGIDEATARATLQHVIDSLAAADTMVAAIRMTGFMIDPQSATETEATVNPVMTARWVPLDTIGLTGARRRTRHRTHFVVLAPLPFASGTDRP